MTKQEKERRERIAAQVLTGIMSNQPLIEIISMRENNLSEKEEACQTAIDFADCLIKRLDK